MPPETVANIRITPVKVEENRFSVVFSQLRLDFGGLSMTRQDFIFILFPLFWFFFSKLRKRGEAPHLQTNRFEGKNRKRYALFVVSFFEIAKYLKCLPLLHILLHVAEDSVISKTCNQLSDIIHFATQVWEQLQPNSAKQSMRGISVTNYNNAHHVLRRIHPILFASFGTWQLVSTMSKPRRPMPSTYGVTRIDPERHERTLKIDGGR